MFEQIEIDYAKILKEASTIAIVGLSPKVNRPSNQVARYLMDKGYVIVPVNPGQEVILGLTCYPNLQSVPVAVDIVDVFRKPADVPGVVDSAIEIGAKVVWLQLGIVHQQAALKARMAGLKVVMDRCIKVDHQHVINGG